MWNRRAGPRPAPSLGPLTVLAGANASGKSNVRDAFRFLHGIARGYTFAEILEDVAGLTDRIQTRLAAGTP